MIAKECTKCYKMKLLKKFYNNKQAKDGKGSWCKQCYKDTRYAKKNSISINMIWFKRELKFYICLSVIVLLIVLVFIINIQQKAIKKQYLCIEKQKNKIVDLKNRLDLKENLEKKIRLIESRYRYPVFSETLQQYLYAIQEDENISDVSMDIDNIGTTTYYIRYAEILAKRSLKKYNFVFEEFFDFSYPFLAEKSYITCEYDENVYRRLRGYSHTGIDIVPMKSMILKNILKGEVVEVIKNDKYLGDILYIYSANEKKKYILVYSHLMEIYVEKNNYVEIDQKIGITSRKGVTTGRHLHLEVWELQNKNGKKYWRAINPVLNSNMNKRVSEKKMYSYAMHLFYKKRYKK